MGWERRWTTEGRLRETLGEIRRVAYSDVSVPVFLDYQDFFLYGVEGSLVTEPAATGLLFLTAKSHTSATMQRNREMREEWRGVLKQHNEAGKHPRRW